MTPATGDAHFEGRSLYVVSAPAHSVHVAPGVALATKERPALFFTVLGEPPLKMLRYQQQFSFFDPEKVNDSIRFVNLSDEVDAHAPGRV